MGGDITKWTTQPNNSLINQGVKQKAITIGVLNFFTPSKMEWKTEDSCGSRGEAKIPQEKAEEAQLSPRPVMSLLSATIYKTNMFL